MQSIIMENTLIKLTLHEETKKTFLVGIIYRHPHEGIQGNELIENQFDKVLKFEKEMYLMGDFNRDLLQENLKSTWLEYMESFGFKQIIESPTRVTDNSRTLIDYIYYTTPNNIISVDVLT